MRSARKCRKSCAHLAPGDHHPHLVEEAERERPDHALGVRAAGVAIEEAELALVADGLPDRRRDRCLRRPSRLPGPTSSVEASRSSRRSSGSTAAILASALRGGGRQPRVGSLGDPARAEHERLDLLVGEHQRRQHEAGLAAHSPAPPRPRSARPAPAAWRCRGRACGSRCPSSSASAAPLTGRRCRRRHWMRSSRRSERDIQQICLFL